jgi:DNA-binding NarL/FixJ family response regulator
LLKNSEITWFILERSKMDKIRVILADDHPITRAGIRRFLDKATDIEIIGEIDNGDDALHETLELKPDVLLLDMEMPGISGVEVAKALKAAGSQVRILALSSYTDRQYIFGVLSSGALGYLSKEEIPQTIVEAVRGVARGEKGWISRKVAAILSSWTQSGDLDENQLTDREIEVLRGVVQGRTNQEIGQELSISPKTVEKHLESIYAKLKVASRVEAAVLAVRENLIKSE